MKASPPRRSQGRGKRLVPSPRRKMTKTTCVEEFQREGAQFAGSSGFEGDSTGGHATDDEMGAHDKIQEMNKRNGRICFRAGPRDGVPDVDGAAVHRPLREADADEEGNPRYDPLEPLPQG